MGHELVLKELNHFGLSFFFIILSIFDSANNTLGVYFVVKHFFHVIIKVQGLKGVVGRVFPSAQMLC